MSCRFATIGDNCVDRYLPLDQATVGGNALNVAVQLALQGQSCQYFGAVGRDDDGRWTHDMLVQNGVSVDHLQELDAPTAYTNLDVDAAGERIIVFEEFGASADYRPTSADIAVLAEINHIHIGWLQETQALRAALAQSNVTISQDFAVNADTTGLDVGFDSVGQSKSRALAALQKLRETGCKVAVVTCGSMGSLAWAGGDVVETGIDALSTVSDTTGAGDTYIAGFLAAWKRGRPLAECIIAGRRAAARTCSHLGGFPQPIKPLKLNQRSKLTDV